MTQDNLEFIRALRANGIQVSGDFPPEYQKGKPEDPYKLDFKTDFNALSNPEAVFDNTAVDTPSPLVLDEDGSKKRREADLKSRTDVSEYKSRNKVAKALDIAANPVQAASYAIKGQTIPDYLPEGESPIDMALDMVNPAAWTNYAKEAAVKTSQGDIIGGGLSALGAIPGVKIPGVTMGAKTLVQPVVQKASQKLGDLNKWLLPEYKKLHNLDNVQSGMPGGVYSTSHGSNKPLSHLPDEFGFTNQPLESVKGTADDFFKALDTKEGRRRLKTNYGLNDKEIERLLLTQEQANTGTIGHFDETGQMIDVNPNLPTGLQRTVWRHEAEHAAQASQSPFRPRYTPPVSDMLFESLRLKNPNIPKGYVPSEIIKKGKEVDASNWKEIFTDLPSAREYIKKPREAGAFGAEIKQWMLDKNLAKSSFDEFTPEMVKKAYKLYQSDKSVPLRLFDLLAPEASKGNFTKMSRAFNKMMALSAPVAAASTSSTPEMQEGNIEEIINFIKDDSNFDNKIYRAPRSKEIVVDGGKYDRTNPTAVRNWSKKNDPIASAVREATDETAKYVGPAVGAALAPGAASLVGSGIRGLATAGEATYGALAPYLSAPAVVGSTTIPAATAGNIINSGFAVHGAQNIVPNTGKLLTNPLSGENLFNAGMNVAELAPIYGPASRLIGKGLNATGTAASKTASKLTPKSIRNSVASRALSNTINSNVKNPIPSKSPLSPRIDLIEKSTVGVKNDFLANMSKAEYDEYIKTTYLNNKDAYDNPLIGFKGHTRPESYYDIGQGEGGTGMLFKEQFCLPGSECAKSANATSSKMYTDITGKPFNTEANAHNAWHMEDQMTRHGGKVIGNDQTRRVGDRVLLGNTVDQSTQVAGYTADPSVRHAGTYAGISKIGEAGHYQPMMFESGKNNEMFLNPIYGETFTGANTSIKEIRPQQFLGDDVGTGVVDKNIRYAFRDTPPVAEFSSQNKTVQKVLTDSEFYKEWLKKTHDITNDEFYEIVNSLIGIGAQETKLKGNLPGSKASKAKIALQDKLNEVGLTEPIKQTINAGKKILNKVVGKSKNPNLPKYPGASVIEMEAAKLADKNNIPFKEAVAQVRSQYQTKDRFTPSTVEASKGPFRQKHAVEKDRLAGFGDDLKNYNEALPHGIGHMAENFKIAQKLYPEATKRQLMDITTLMWNSPAKARNRELVEFNVFGKGNPDLSKFNFDYIRKVNKNKDQYIDVHPKGERSLNFEFGRGDYPEILYREGGDELNKDKVRVKKEYRGGGMEMLSEDNIAFKRALMNNGINISSTGYKHDSPDRNNAANLIVGDNVNGTNLTMQGVPHGVRATGVDTGKTVDMIPGVKNYSFPQDRSVMEVPLYRNGGREIPEYQDGGSLYKMGFGSETSNMIQSEDKPGDGLGGEGGGASVGDIAGAAAGYATAAATIGQGIASATGLQSQDTVAQATGSSGETQAIVDSSIDATVSSIPIAGQFYQLGSAIGDGVNIGRDAFLASGDETGADAMSAVSGLVNPGQTWGKNAEMYEAGYITEEEGIMNAILTGIGGGAFVNMAMDQKTRKIAKNKEIGSITRATGGQHLVPPPTTAARGKFTSNPGYPKKA